MALQADIHFYNTVVYQYATVLMHNKIPDLNHWRDSEDLWKWLNKCLFIRTDCRPQPQKPTLNRLQDLELIASVMIYPSVNEKKSSRVDWRDIFSHKSRLRTHHRIDWKKIKRKPVFLLAQCFTQLHKITQFEAFFFFFQMVCSHTEVSRLTFFYRWKVILCNDLRMATIRTLPYVVDGLYHKEVEPPNSVVAGSTGWQLACTTWLSMDHGQAGQGCSISQHCWRRDCLSQAGMKQDPGPWAGYREVLVGWAVAVPQDLTYGERQVLAEGNSKHLD